MANKTMASTKNHNRATKALFASAFQTILGSGEIFVNVVNRSIGWVKCSLKCIWNKSSWIELRGRAANRSKLNKLNKLLNHIDFVWILKRCNHIRYQSHTCSLTDETIPNFKSILNENEYDQRRSIYLFELVACRHITIDLDFHTTYTACYC